jgi:hypothetical protein
MATSQMLPLISDVVRVDIYCLEHDIALGAALLPLPYNRQTPGLGHTDRGAGSTHGGRHTEGLVPAPPSDVDVPGMR